LLQEQEAQSPEQQLQAQGLILMDGWLAGQVKDFEKAGFQKAGRGYD